MWQTKLGHCLYTSPKGYKVYQNAVYRWLTFGNNTTQTLINRYAPQRPILHYLPALTLMAELKKGDCCLFGLGGGALVHILSSSHKITVIEKDEEVIQIAKRYFMMEGMKNITIVQDNAAHYVQQRPPRFSHLLIDLYNANHYPEECASTLFFHHCKNLLEPNGYLAINLANPKEQWPIYKLIQDEFETSLVIPIKKSANMVIIASKNGPKRFIFDTLLTCSAFKTIEWTTRWGYVGQLLS